MESIIQDEKECFVCGTTYNLESHHCIYGSANRKLSEKYGLKLWLCQEHHTGNCGVHFNKNLDCAIKQLAQRKYEERFGNRESFRSIFGKSYL